MIEYEHYLAQWRSGNAAVCKTDMRGFDSLLRLQIYLFKVDFCQFTLILRLYNLIDKKY